MGTVGGTLPHKALSYVNNSCRSESSSIFLQYSMLLKGKYDLRLQIKACFRKKHDILFSKAKIRGGFFYVRINFALDFYITDFHLLCPFFMYLSVEYLTKSKKLKHNAQ